LISCRRPPSRFPDAIAHCDPGTIARSSGLAMPQMNWISPMGVHGAAPTTA
jgi:hypothetical protein